MEVVYILNLEGEENPRGILKFIRTNLPRRRVIAVVRPYIARAAIKDHGQGRMEWEGREGEVWGLEICAQCKEVQWTLKLMFISNPTRILHGDCNRPHNQVRTEKHVT